MQTFRATCAKNNQKIELVVQHDTIEEARSELHKQGYSIIDIKAVENTNPKWKVFYFDVLIDNTKKSGQIQSSDIFKAYIKLVDDLHYNVLAIYESRDVSEEEKKLTTSKVRANYLLYTEQNSKKKSGQSDSKKNDNNIKKAETAKKTELSEAFIGKEIQTYYLLIDRALAKIENLINLPIVAEEKKKRLSEIHITLKQLKNTTNTNKLRITAQSLLLEIWKLELEISQEDKDLKKQGYVNETNELLKKFGSSQKIRDPEEDIYLKAKVLFKSLFSWNKKSNSDLLKNSSPDTESFVFYERLRELNIYKKKLRELQKDIFFATFLFQKEKKKRLILKKRLVVQNIQLISKRIKNTQFSYTKVVKWLAYYGDLIIWWIRGIGEIFLYAAFLFSFFFLFLSSISKWEFVNYSVIYPLVLITFFAFLTKFIKTVGSLCLFSSLYILFFFFLQVNF